MVWRLITDVIWRTRVMYLWMFPLVLLLWVLVAVGEVPMGMGLTLTLMLAYAMGPIAAISTTNLREIRVLPVTNREIWLTTCTMATVVGPLFLLVVQMLAVTGVLAVTGSAGVTPEALLLSTLYAFLYAGTLLTVGPLLGYTSSKTGSGRLQWLWIALMWACLLAFIGGFGLPWFFAAALPVALDQFTPLMTVALAACLIITGGAWAGTPRRGVVVSNNQALRRGASPTSLKSRGRLADRFTGIARIAWSHACITIVVSLITIGVFVAYWAVFDSGEELWAFMQRAALLPFDTSFQTDLENFGGITVVWAFMAIAGNGVWNPLARQLKVLPLTVREVNGLFLVTPLVTWTLIWIVLIVTHRVVTGSFPDTLRSDVLIFSGGTSAAGQVLALRFHRGRGTFPWVFMPLSAATVIVTSTIRSTPTLQVSLALGTAGLVAFGVAALVNHRTLTRSTSSANAYQRQQLPVGINGSVGPR